jgi:predicted ferric reductase
MAARDLTLTRGEQRAGTGQSALNDINTVGQFGKEMLYFVTIMSNILYCQRYTQQNMNYTPWKTVHVKNLINAYIVKPFSAIYGMLGSINVFIRASCWCQTWRYV